MIAAFIVLSVISAALGGYICYMELSRRTRAKGARQTASDMFGDADGENNSIEAVASEETPTVDTEKDGPSD